MSLPFSPFFRRSCECLREVGSRIPKPASFARIVGTTNCRKRIRSKNLEAMNQERQVDRELYSTIRQTIIKETSEKGRPFLKEVIQIICDTFLAFLLSKVLKCQNNYSFNCRIRSLRATLNKQWAASLTCLT